MLIKPHLHLFVEHTHLLVPSLVSALTTFRNILSYLLKFESRFVTFSVYLDAEAKDPVMLLVSYSVQDSPNINHRSPCFNATVVTRQRKLLLQYVQQYDCTIAVLATVVGNRWARLSNWSPSRFAQLICTHSP